MIFITPSHRQFQNYQNIYPIYIVLLKQNIQTNQDENFLLVNENENHIIIFLTINNINS